MSEQILQDAAHTLLRIPENLNDLHFIIETKDRVRKALDELEQMSDAAEKTRDRNRARLATDRERLREVLAEYDKGSIGEKYIELHLVLRDIRDILGVENFVPVLATFCSWLLKEAKRVPYYADFGDAVKMLQMRENMHLSDQGDFPFTHPDIEYIGRLSESVRKRIWELTAPEKVRS